METAQAKTVNPADPIDAVLQAFGTPAQIMLEARMRTHSAAELLKMQLDNEDYKKPNERARALAVARTNIETAMLWIDKARKL